MVPCRSVSALVPSIALITAMSLPAGGGAAPTGPPPACAAVAHEVSPPICLAAHPMDSLSRDNPSTAERRVWSSEVTSARPVPWIQIRLAAETRLAPGSRLRIASIQDPGFVVEVRDRDLHWLDGVGYLIPHGFPGDRIRLELFAAPGSTGNRVTIDHVVLGV